MTKVPYRPLAPRFHILGPGGIGSLFAYYFHRHQIPFTLFQRKAPPPLPPSLSNKTNSNTPPTLKYMNLTALDTASVEPQVVDGVDWEPLYPIIDKELFRYDPVYNELSRSPIHRLLVTTKTYQTVEAISKVRHRLRPWTTIVLMQNGMGVREEICESMGWTDNDAERPNFVQGIISHGAQKMGDTIVHTGRGHVWLAPIVDTHPVISGTTKDKQDPSTPGEKSILQKPQPKLDSETLADIDALLPKPDDGSLFPTLQEPSKTVRSTKYPYTNPSTFIAPFTNAPFSSFYVQPSSSEELRNLRTRSLYETLAAFQLLSTDMDLKILMPEHLLALQFSKLVVNACVNPVATLLEATNGTLLDSAEANQAVKDLIKECLSILSHSKEFQALDEPLRNEFLTLETLTETTEAILRATKSNRCSTLQDYLKGSQQCEIDYMNGYLIKMAERCGRAAPLNKMVTEKVKDKFASPRKNPTPVE
ncbi:2-dehydropantoate 2-reductase (Ketopantoate reductase) (KPA reductase) (KPR) [Mortierella alpina]|nr:2-dehydropantoate 2-reductase (Ketopantoate reductase) (KPA reductase) (KPR) [Mortierella alpina]